MATTFKRDDAKTCFHCGVNPPAFRLISLERFPNENGDLVPDTMAALFCESAHTHEARNCPLAYG